jgi:hypothetical protein
MSKILVTEVAEYGTLREYINIHPEYLNVLFFQIIYTLAQINSKIPGFVHGDFHGNNIFIKKDPNYDPSKKKLNIYYFMGQWYCLPVIPVQAKIADFGVSYIVNELPNLIFNSEVYADSPPSTTIDHYSDLNTLIEGLMNIISNDNKLYPLLKQIKNTKYITAQTVMNDKFIKSNFGCTKPFDMSRVAHVYGEAPPI